MPENIRALITVLVLAMPAFYLSRQLAARLIAPREFAVWRNVWFAVTAAAFLSGSFLVFAAIVTMICVYARSIRAATVPLFVAIMFAAPLINWQIGGFGIVNWLLDVNYSRLLAVVLLLPILLSRGGAAHPNGGVYAIPDRLIVGYTLLLIAIKSDNVTQAMRLTMELSLDVLIPYFALSRAVSSMAEFHKVLLAFVVAVLPLSVIAVFETVKHWLLYSSVTYNWAGASAIHYQVRGDMLRASGPATSSIVLGFVIMVAIGCMLALREAIGSRKISGIALAILSAGLVASLSRGPWVGAMVLILVYLAASPNAFSKLAKFVVVGAVVLIPLLLTPVGSRLFDLLPFIGSVEVENVTYRQRLYDNAIIVIERNLWFGSPDYLLTPEMQEMMQGEHIIDIVNTYLKIALESGLVGLGLFVGLFAAILIGLLRLLKVSRDVSFGSSVRASMATVLAMMVTIATVSSIDFIPYVYWSFGGLCVALIRIGYNERAVRPVPKRPLASGSTPR